MSYCASFNPKIKGFFGSLKTRLVWYHFAVYYCIVISQDQVNSYAPNMVQGMLSLLRNCPQVCVCVYSRFITYIHV